MSETQDLAWLVDRRSQIQQLILKLYDFSERSADSLDDARGSAYQLLVGAAFSLWRAAFLVYEERPLQRVLDDAKKFLYLLVRDNAINYSQDRETNAWTVGYYINNACFRLHRAANKLWSNNAQPASCQYVEVFLDRGAGAAVPHARELWDRAHAAAIDVFNKLAEP